MRKMEDFLPDFTLNHSDWLPLLVASFIGSVLAFKLLYISGREYRSNVRLNEKIVIITGASSGIGLEVAKNLSKRGANIVLAVRNAERGKCALQHLKTLNDSTVIAKLVDLSDLTSIRDFVNQIQLEYGRIDVLINNAGTYPIKYETTVEGNEVTMATNYFGPFLLTHLLLPLLNNADNGRVINVTGLGRSRKAKLDPTHLNPTEFCAQQMFKDSKLALTLFTKHLSTLLENTRITVNAVNPGRVVGTGHLKNQQFNTIKPLKYLVWPWHWLVRKTAKQGSQTVIFAAVEPALRNRSGTYLVNCAHRPDNMTELINDLDLQRDLYQNTCRVVGIEGHTIINQLI